MPDMERISVTRRIPAPAAVIFAEVSSPAGHVRIDGSGMLVAAPDAKPVTRIGDTFEMQMDRTPLGDLPGVTDYTVVNTVTAFVPDRQMEWGVSPPGRPPVGYVYGYLIDPIDTVESEVTSYFDWSGLSDRHKARAGGRYPLIPETTLAATLQRLEAVVTGKA
jgi:hypothetical protein